MNDGSSVVGKNVGLDVLGLSVGDSVGADEGSVNDGAFEG